MSNQNVSVSFKVAGGNDLENYIASVQKKSAALTNEAIKATIAQTDKGKELLAITNAQIVALERKNRLETQANRSILLDRRGSDLAANSSTYEARRNEIYANTGLSEQAKREKILAATGSEAAMADKIKNDYRENLTLVREQEKQSKLQTSLAKENLTTLKETARDNVKAIMTGDLKLADVIRGASTDEEKLISKLTQEGVEKEKKQQAKENGGGQGMLGSLLTVDNISRFVTTASQIGQTTNGFDQIGNTGRALSTAIGTALGAVVGSIFPGIGTVAGAGVGGSIANLIGGTASDFVQRTAIAKQDFLKASYGYGSITGSEPGAFTDVSGIGVSGTQFLKIQSEFAKRRGNRNSSSQTALDALYLERGFGVDNSTSSGLVDIQRSAKESNRNLAELIGGVLAKGQSTYFKNGDTTFLGEFLSKFTILQKELLKTNNAVGTAGTYDILSRFNNIGGAFATSDPRSGGLISTINSSLSNPQGDYRKALSFYALKKNNPNMSLVELIQEQQRGLASPNYLNSVLSMIDQGGGSESFKPINVAGMLGLENNQAFATRLYKGYKAGKLNGPFASGELSGLYDFKGRAEGNTSDPDKSAAKITNNSLRETSDAVEAIVYALQTAVKDALSGSVIELANGKIIPLSKATIQKNATTAGAERARLDAIPSWQMQNQIDAHKNGGVHHK